MDYKYGQPIFKDYVLKAQIGEGGYSCAYLVENAVRQYFALKVLSKNSQSEKRGVEAVMRIHSSHLVKIIDYGKTFHGEFCVLMEYMSKSFTEIIQSGIREENAVRFYMEILKGLKVLRKHGIVHRDIKPSNLFVEDNLVKIGDFGSARYTSGVSSTKSKGIGTLNYFAPECFDNYYGHDVDLWAANVIFYQMFSGKFPFEGEHFTGTIGSIMRKEPDFSVVPNKYVAFFRQCFAKDPNERFVGIEEIFSVLNKIAKPDKPGMRISSPKLKKDFKVEYRLRDECKTLSEKDIKTMLAKYGFFDRDWNKDGYFRNAFIEEGNGTVIDCTTGLEWQKSGSKDVLLYKKLSSYVERLNLETFSGYNDWRLPTIEELGSLLKSKQEKDISYIDSVFDSEPFWCWSADLHPDGYVWLASFSYGNIYRTSENLEYYVRLVRCCQ